MSTAAVLWDQPFIVEQDQEQAHEVVSEPILEVALPMPAVTPTLSTLAFMTTTMGSFALSYATCLLVMYGAFGSAGISWAIGLTIWAAYVIGVPTLWFAAAARGEFD